MRGFFDNNLATYTFRPGALWDNQGIQGPYGYMGGQRGFNPNYRDYWGYDAIFYAHGGYGPPFVDYGRDTVADAYRNLN